MVIYNIRFLCSPEEPVSMREAGAVRNVQVSSALHEMVLPTSVQEFSPACVSSMDLSFVTVVLHFCLTYSHFLSHLCRNAFPLLLLEATWLFIPKAVELGCIFFHSVL